MKQSICLCSTFVFENNYYFSQNTSVWGIYNLIWLYLLWKIIAFLKLLKLAFNGPKKCFKINSYLQNYLDLMCKIININRQDLQKLFEA